MEYRKLNLVNGPEEDLHSFMAVLHAAIAAKNLQVDMALLAKLAAAGGIEAYIAEANGVLVGVQVWELGSLWDTSTKICASRFQYLDSTVDSDSAQALFLMYGAKAQQSAYPETKCVAIEYKNNESTFLLNCGLQQFAQIYTVIDYAH